MELTKLYVLVVNGKKHFFGSEIDRNYGFNVLTQNGTIPSEKYEIELEK
jgi:hypothetical protein